ncbi:uncharacterized protein BJX67DRAFT_219736 [Aspergillus lucknowensis]|uniref:Uncharacterized protein n=1 Tax=Aspergillus lucknowensis TaxID=176173 RepID=A0ABR4LIS2_9EURO
MQPLSGNLLWCPAEEAELSSAFALPGGMAPNHRFLVLNCRLKFLSESPRLKSDFPRKLPKFMLKQGSDSAVSLLNRGSKTQLSLHTFIIISNGSAGSWSFFSFHSAFRRGQSKIWLFCLNHWMHTLGATKTIDAMSWGVLTLFKFISTSHILCELMPRPS